MVEMPIRILERELNKVVSGCGRQEGEISMITDKPPGNRYFWRQDVTLTHYLSRLVDLWLWRLLWQRMTGGWFWDFCCHVRHNCGDANN